MADEPTAERRTAIYFSRESGQMAKDLAARCRNESIKTLLIWADQFQDEGDIEGVQAIIVEHHVPQANKIVTAYQNFAAGVEIHFVDSEGEFVDAEGNELPDEPEEPTEGDGPQVAAPTPEPTTDETADATEDAGPGEADEAGDSASEEDSGGPEPVES